MYTGYKEYHGVHLIYKVSLNGRGSRGGETHTLSPPPVAIFIIAG